jgi:hypothetical protein
VQSFHRFYSWPGVAFVPIRDAPVEQTVLAGRATDRRPVVAAFRSIATTLAGTVSAVDARFCGPVRDGTPTRCAAASGGRQNPRFDALLMLFEEGRTAPVRYVARPYGKTTILGTVSPIITDGCIAGIRRSSC